MNTETHHLSQPSRRRRIVPTALAATVLAALALSACSSGSGSPSRTSDGIRPAAAVPSTGTSTDPSSSSPTSGTTPSSAAPASSAPVTPDATPVHISLFNNDGATYGVGMPVIAYFSKMITDDAPLQKATTVTVNGQPAQGAWYFERSGAGNGPLEAHFRLAHYWPAHSQIRVDIAAKGVSAGKGLAYDDTLFSAFRTGAANIAVVDNTKHTITVTSDGTLFGTFPVSLGAKTSPTERGTKVIMEQDQDTRMQGDSLSGHYDDPHVYWTQRLTYGGEYLHAAPWNDPAENNGIGNIGTGNSSNGCTNLTTTDARKLFKFLDVGDVVNYPNANGPKMKLSDGYGDWNLTWTQWQTGGLAAIS